MVSKLLDGKVAFVHKRLWPALLAVASALEPWQMTGLSGEGVHTGTRWSVGDCRIVRADLGGVEPRLVVHGDQIHTESGKHQTRLETWKAWALRTECKPDGTAAQGPPVLEAAVRGLGGSIAILPWHRL